MVPIERSLTQSEYLPKVPVRSFFVPRTSRTGQGAKPKESDGPQESAIPRPASARISFLFVSILRLLHNC